MFYQLFLTLCASAVLAAPNNFKNLQAKGQNATEGQFPYQVGLLSDDGSIFCSGAIISSDWILTSASCIYGHGPIMYVYLGSVEFVDIKQTSSTTSIIIHEHYTPQPLVNDIAVANLYIPLQFNDLIKPIALTDVEPEPETQAIVAGWTAPEKNHRKFYMNLQYTTLEIMQNSHCEEVYGATVTDKILCTFAPSVGGDCFNDGGAPLVVGADFYPVHVGVLSFLNSHSCDLHYPLAYSSTAQYRDWIREKTSV